MTSPPRGGDPVGPRSGVGLAPDASRVIGRLFVPGHALAGERAGRASHVVEHVLAMSSADVAAAVDRVVDRFGDRHRDLTGMLDRHAERLADRVAPDVELSPSRRSLLGATFTQEYAVESASVCNPSAVVAPDQGGLGTGELRIVLSIRQIGEGHRSSIGFRSIVVGVDGALTIEPRGRYATAGETHDVVLDPGLFSDLGPDVDPESVRWVLAGLGPAFAPGRLVERLHGLAGQRDTRRDVDATSARMAERAARRYGVRFPPPSDLGERVLTPSCAVESHGMEDARFVRFVDDDGSVTYFAPYTAYDGSAIAQQLLATSDFRTFTSTPLLGDAAANKGLALFPRRIGGRFHALSRHDGERNGVASSDDLRRWADATPLEVASAGWSSVQVGNCGSPIELDEGWLVLTHGVGPMRTYSIGALLLDLDDPRTVLGQTARPLISPAPDEQDGYVPNVVYSCGAVRHGDRLVVPLGIADRRIGFSTLTIADVLAALSGGDDVRPTVDQEVNHHA